MVTSPDVTFLTNTNVLALMCSDRNLSPHTYQAIRQPSAHSFFKLESFHFDHCLTSIAAHWCYSVRRALGGNKTDEPEHERARARTRVVLTLLVLQSAEWLCIWPTAQLSRILNFLFTMPRSRLAWLPRVRVLARVPGSRDAVHVYTPNMLCNYAPI